MLSPDYFEFRWSWYRPILNRGEEPSGRCKVDARRLPVRIAGEDASEYIPYAIHSSLQQVFSTSVRRLQDYSIRYMLKGEKVSAHQLPQMNPVAREMAKHLRQRYPHLPQSLLHHWCADERGALGMFKAWQDMWRQSWKQDQTDVAPWVPAVNVLILRLIREAIQSLPDEHAAHTDHIMVSMVGGLYDWALRGFLRQQVDGAVEVTRIATYEAMMIPVTPIAFLYRQPADSLLGDDRYVVLAYGLEADLIPRLRALREKVGAKNEAGILPLLARDRMGEHFLKRSWMRLALWDLAERTGQGVWMQWVLDAKKLDQLMSRPETLPEPVARLLQQATDHPLAAWLLARRAGKKEKEGSGPWLHDDRVLMAFRVFEEDVKIEVARRKYEKVWMDQRAASGSKGRGGESDKLLEAAYEEGRLVYFQPDPEKSLHSGSSLSARQGCLRIDWADYLSLIMARHEQGQAFVSKQLLPGVLARIEQQPEVFMDDLSAGGCTLRGTVAPLVAFGMAIRTMLAEWLQELQGEGDSAMALALPMCMTLVGDWSFVRFEDKKQGNFNLAIGPAVAQAHAGVSHDCGAARLMAEQDKQEKVQPLGGVHLIPFQIASGRGGITLHNQGFALSGAVVSELTSALRHRAKVREHRLPRDLVQATLSGYRLPQGEFDLLQIEPNGDDEKQMLLFKAGRACLANVDVELYEMLVPDSPVYRKILNDGLPRWSKKG